VDGTRNARHGIKYRKPIDITPGRLSCRGVEPA
jgi:hypothetical protein